jgi:hypothetical protein
MRATVSLLKSKIQKEIEFASQQNIKVNNKLSIGAYSTVTLLAKFLG